MFKQRILFFLPENRFKLLEPLVNILAEHYVIDIYFSHKETIKTFGKSKNININHLSFNNLYPFNNVILILKRFNKNSFIQILLEKIFTISFNITYSYLIKSFKDKNYILNINYGSTDINSCILNKALHDLNIPVLVPYFMIQPGLSYKYDSLKINSIYEYFIYKKFNTKKFPFLTNNNHYPYEPYIINALFKYKSLPDSPYILGGYTYNTTICQVSNKGMNALIQRGIKKDNITIIGDLQSDKLFHSQTKNNKNNKKTIILSLIQYFENNYFDKETTKKKHEFLVKTLGAIENTKLILSLHPIMNIDNYKYLEKKYNCKIAIEDLSLILHQADLFVTSHSNTILWALLLKVPVINYDFDGWEWDEEPINFKQVKTIKKKNQLKEFSISLINMKLSFKEDHKELQIKKTFNGRVLNNYLELVNKLIRKRTPIITIKSNIFYKLYELIYNYNIKKKIFYLNHKSYYISPYSSETVKIQYYIEKNTNKSNFLGFIDRNKEGENIFNPSDTPLEKNAILVIGPTNHYLNIKNKLKKVFTDIIYFDKS